MENKKTLYVVLALVVGIVVGYMTGGSNLRIQDQGASVRTSKVSDSVTNLTLEGSKTINCDPDVRHPVVKVLTPNGGESYDAGQLVSVEWESCPMGQNIVMISLYSSLNNMSTELTTTSDDGQENIIIPITLFGSGTPAITPGNYYKIGVSLSGNPNLRDFSDGYFSIKSFQTPCKRTAFPKITITSPNGGETFVSGQPITVKWTSCNVPPNALLSINVYNSNPTTMFGFLAPNGTPNDGEEVISTVGWPAGTNYELIVGVPQWGYNNSGMMLWDATDSMFNITP